MYSLCIAIANTKIIKNKALGFKGVGDGAGGGNRTRLSIPFDWPKIGNIEGAKGYKIRNPQKWPFLMYSLCIWFMVIKNTKDTLNPQTRCIRKAVFSEGVKFGSCFMCHFWPEGMESLVYYIFRKTCD